MKQIILIIAFSILILFAYAAAPVVSNVIATPGSGRVNISYNLSAEAPCKISVVVSSDGGANYNIYPSALSGDVGDQISAGIGKHIVWTPAADNMGVGSNYYLKVIARDNPIQNETQFTSFILVEGGTFHNGTSNVSISSFYLDKYEITQNDYQAVMGTTPSYYSGNPSRPVEKVTWFNAIEYCNRRSMLEGLTPCYSYSTFGTNPLDWPAGWNTDINHTNVNCNWSADGYRLPTEMEWMYAAKGGNLSQGYTYSGSNVIGNVAWYSGNSGSRTHNVGELAANECGAFDMSGNVREWCWDIYASPYPAGDQNNPTGPTSGNHHPYRGGSWLNDALYCTVSARLHYIPTVTSYEIGFRCVRISP